MDKPSLLLTYPPKLPFSWTNLVSPADLSTKRAIFVDKLSNMTDFSTKSSVFVDKHTTNKSRTPEKEIRDCSYHISLRTEGRRQKMMTEGLPMSA